MSDETMEAGWQADPTGRFSHRYFDGASWTEHVAQDGATSSDPLQAPPGSPAPRARLTATPADAAAMADVPGTAKVVALADSPEAVQRRKTLGIWMLAALGLVLFSLFFPWISGAEEYTRGDSVTLTGVEFAGGMFVGISTIPLGLYAAQAVVRPRVRYHLVATLVFLGPLIAISLFTFLGTDQDDLDRLGVPGASSGRVVDFPSDPNGPGARFSYTVSEDDPFAHADQVDREFGANVGALGGLAATYPLVALWRDDRARRRAAGLLA